ncbi:MAG: FecR domain-containing protein [Cyclobacteriaceae bacterium]
MNKTIDDLIVKSLVEEVSQEDQEVLDKWIGSNPRNRKIYSELKGYWQLNEKDYQIKDEVWQSIKESADDFNNTVKVKRRRFNPFLSIAAAFLVVATSTALIFSFLKSENSAEQQISMIKKKCPTGSKLIVRLPDGSHATLNSNSFIEYPSQFEGELRLINLKGEAFFDVIPNPSKPFVVKTKALNTTVLGTSFNVRAYHSEHKTKVAVASGKVKVELTESEQPIHFVLNPSEMSIFNKTQGSFEKTKFDQLSELGWKDGIIYFNKTSFGEVKNILEKWYGVKIEVDGNINESFHYTATYNNQPLESVLEGMKFVQPFDYSIKGEVININFN